MLHLFAAYYLCRVMILEIRK